MRVDRNLQMTLPRDIGHNEVSKTSLGGHVQGSASSQQRPTREMGHLTCDEGEVEDLMSAGEST